MNRSPAAWLLTLTLIAAAGAAAAEDPPWTGWRGPQRDGIAMVAPPQPWPARLLESWRVEVGTGHASPLVDGGRIYLFSRLEDRETVSALELADGSVVWRQSYEAPYSLNPSAYLHGRGPKSTPVLAGGRLFTLGINGILSAWDAASGKPLWRRDFADRFRSTAPLFGTAMSPLVDGERLIAHVGGHDDGAIAAFDVASGEEIWRWSGDGPGYASPVIGELDGVRTLVTQTQQRLVGLDPASGALLWDQPFTTPWIQNSVTPVVRDGVLYFSGLAQGLSAVRPRRTDQGWAVEPVWHTDEISLYMSSPVTTADRICGFSHLAKGQYFCASIATGDLIWTSEGRQGENAAILGTLEWLVALDDGARLQAFASTGEGTPAVVYTVSDSPTWAHPVLLGDGVLVKDKTHLIRHRFAG